MGWIYLCSVKNCVLCISYIKKQLHFSPVCSFRIDSRKGENLEVLNCNYSLDNEIMQPSILSLLIVSAKIVAQ